MNGVHKYPTISFRISPRERDEIEAKIKIDKSSKKQLEDLLRSNGVTEEEITELIKMVDNDNHNLNDKIIGSNTNSWMQKMIGKAINGTWNKECILHIR